MTTQKVLLVKYGEIALRKGNRTHFEHHLLDAIRHNLQTEISQNQIEVKREQGRFLIQHPAGQDIHYPQTLAKIKDIFGLTGFCQAIKTTATDINDLRHIGASFYNQHITTPKTFKVKTKRSDKNYPLLSGQISGHIGEAIITSNPSATVDLHNPDVTLWVELRNHTYFYIDSIPGAGGLPYGASGKAVLLLSGGFDSPIAGYLTARRGVAISCIYFHSPPFVSDRALDKVKDLARELSRFTGTINLCTIPFTDVQLFLKDNTPAEKLTIMLKRAMLHIASQLAEEQNAQAIITGDSIGQVASQTMQSLAAVDSAASTVVLRPLSIYDKQEIIDIAKKIGTYDISVRPYDDCCTLFVAKHPENKPSKKAIEKMESRYIDRLTPLMDTALQNATWDKL